MTYLEDVATACGKATKRGKGWRCLCPAHNDSNPSLDLDEPSPDKYVFICRAGCSQDAVISALSDRRLWPPPHNATSRKPTPVHQQLGEPTEVYSYRDASGALVGVVCRWDGPQFPGGKKILPAIPKGSKWVWKGIPTPRPMYRLADVLGDTEAQVLVVEGERKCNDANRVLAGALIAVAWANGTNSVHLTDWTPLRGRSVVLWPDNDSTGDAAMARLASALAALPVAALKVLRRDASKPPKWDIGDAIRKDGMDRDQILSYARDHAEVWPITVHDDEPAPAPPPPLSPLSPPAPPTPLSPTPQSATIVQLKPATRERPKPKPQHSEAVIGSDDHLAIEFTRRHGDGLRYVAVWGRWLRWTGAVWTEETTLLAYDYARHLCREFAKEIDDVEGKGAKPIASSKTVNAVVALAKADRAHAVEASVWDADPWMLNTPGGVVNLHTSAIHPHRQSDHMTKITGVAPDFDMQIPLWNEFLERITDGDRELISFLQRVVGYSLTGVTREHAMFFLYGTGGNGKGVFLSTIVGCLGSYATTAPIETFTAQRGERHPTELAMLRGARMVTAQETEEGRRWAESRIKALTGGDRISARFMRQDFFEFTPQFKLLVAGNHKPGLRTVDEAIRRRFHLIPFTVTIPAAERDLELGERLKAEWPGILAWMVDGCVEWQERGGLHPPEAVRCATDEYLETEDAIAAWIEDRCQVGDNLSVASAAAYSSWKSWADKNGEWAGSNKQFAQKMEARGFARVRLSHGMIFRGFAVIEDITPSPSDEFWRGPP